MFITVALLAAAADSLTPEEREQLAEMPETDREAFFFGRLNQLLELAEQKDRYDDHAGIN